MRTAVIGLGVMGSGIATRLAAQGHVVSAYNRTRARAEAAAAAGVRVAATPRDAAAESEVVILILSDDAATRACTDGPEGVLAGLVPGSLVLQMGTLSPDAVLKLAGDVESAGSAFIDGPVMGSAAEASSGNLWVLAGADDAVLARARPVLDAIAQEVYHIGPIGQGARLKLANNLLGGNLVTALAETMALVEAFGIDPSLYAQILAGTNLGTRMLTGKARQMAAGDFAARFSIANERKDIHLALEQAALHGLRLRQGEGAALQFDEAHARGLDDQDIAAMRKVVN